MQKLLYTQSLAIGHGKKPIATAINMVVNEGELVALVGRNGSGKTTLIKTIAGLLPAISGNVFVNDVNMDTVPTKKKGRYMATVLTHKNQLMGFDVASYVALGRYPYSGKFGWTQHTDYDIAQSCIEKLNITHLATKTLFELSDGEMQKATLARALAQQTPLIILDEPTAYLDYVAREEIFQLLKAIAKEGKAILFSSHDLELVQRFASRILLIENGELKDVASVNFSLNS